MDWADHRVGAGYAPTLRFVMLHRQTRPVHHSPCFEGCSNLSGSPSDNLNLTGETDLSAMVADAARQNMIDTDNWAITDGGRD
jgi:hypothetical protein